jgi:heme-degrading monooxygenase HmoA
MVVEVAQLTIDGNRHDEYTQAVKKAFLQARPEGMLGCQVLTKTDDPSDVIVLIQWESSEMHAKAQGTPANENVGRAAQPFVRAATVADYTIETLV